VHNMFNMHMMMMM